ncbi:general stress protein CsbD [Mycobacterium sp. E2238]|uniref:microaggregate-binding protein 1 n=1 Tax=Mycobacterium sp. E2238 TaxID=1834131 RepID=UPI0007FE18A6|nr:general stress protein CsbD [Mycobacterium sp. E2238]OBI23931.1 general stress protein CsbD [Mycobacterium sp. E2238]
MVDIKSGPVEAVQGIVQAVFGKAKEIIGTIIGRNDLVNEGQAQQDKADAQRNAAKKEAAAEKARAKAKTAEARQKAEQQ